MAQAVKLHDPGEGIHDAEVAEIPVSAGDEVKEGQVVLVVETDKATFEIESPYSGIVEKVHVRVGERMDVGQTLLTVDATARAASSRDAEDEKDRRSEEPVAREADADEAASAGPEEGEGTDEDETDQEQLRKTGVPEDDRKQGRKRERPDEAVPVPASPATRRLARDLGVDLGEVEATGDEGRVLAQDVRAHAAGSSRRERRDGAARPPRPLPDFSRWGPVERAPLRSVRRTIARRMAEAWESIPHVTHNDVADITELDAFRRRQTDRLESAEDKLTFTVLAMKAAAAVLGEFPRFNASLDAEREEIIYKRYFHLGVAIDTSRGLLVPTIRDVDRKSVRELAHELGELSERARSGALGRDEMLRGTFTITNVGAIGGTHFNPIINSPQVAILGLGRSRWEPRLRDHGESAEVVPRLVLPLCLAFDHRVNDGADAARFMNRLVEILGDPEWFTLTV